ncbi:MAG: inorganic pyrophosphatase [Halioglobus sp.]
MKISYFLISILFLVGSSCKQEKKERHNPKIETESFKSKGDMAYENVIALNSDSSINMIVEISAGTTAKYEMNKNTYQIVMDSIDGQPRYINYLGYPGNYGMIPNTILSKSEGGDGDPLDILLLGVSQSRGSIQKARMVGVMKLLDNGEQDDKILAVPLTEKWSKVQNIEDLDLHFPGARDIVSIFFTNYKAKGEMKFESWGGRKEAMKVVNLAHDYPSLKK